MTIFVEGPVLVDSAIGPLELGVVNAQLPGVAEGVSRLLMRSIQDARSEVGGHLPSWLVDDIQQNYISPEKVRTLWAETGHRFALREPESEEIVGTIHLAKSESMILTVDRFIINVDEREHPGFKPPRHHHVVNISVRHELRRAKLGTVMVEGIVRHFRHLFTGIGLWVRADPPWHPGLAGLGFVHDPALDVFLPANVERTAGLPHPDFNRRYACDCGERRPELDTHKLQYVSMTRPFEAVARPMRAAGAPSLSREELRDCGPFSSTADVARPGAIDEVANVLAWASREGRKVTIRGQGQSYHAQSVGDDVVLSTERLTGIREISRDHVRVHGGTTWRELLEALRDENTRTNETRFPPVVPSHVEASIGGTLASVLGGIGKGSIHHGVVADHVESMLVITGDGRRIECSRKQAAWLFEAVLCGSGRFGVIAEATLRLGDRPRFVVRSERTATSAELSDVLSDPTLEHASATLVADDTFRVLLTHPVTGADDVSEPATSGQNEPISIAQHLLPPRPEPSEPMAAAIAFDLDLPRTHRDHVLVRVFPVFARSGPGLMRMRAATEGLRLVAWSTTPVEPKNHVPTSGSWEHLGGPIADQLRLAKRLADPRSVLGPKRHERAR